MRQFVSVLDLRIFIEARDGPARLKGIETDYSAFGAAGLTADTRDGPARLKGIETVIGMPIDADIESARDGPARLKGIETSVSSSPFGP